MAGEDERTADGVTDEDRERRLQREREKAGREEHDAAAGPGYTARPTEEEPEPRDPGSRGG